MQVNENLQKSDLVEIEYKDAITNEVIKVKVTPEVKKFLKENDTYLRKQRREILKNECPYKPEIDDLLVEEEQHEEGNLEEEYLKTIDQIYENKEKIEKIQKFFKKHIFEFSQNEVIILFLSYYLGFSRTEIKKYFGLTKQRIHSLITQIEQKLKKFH